MEQFDVIILDRMLGDLDGLTILRRLRESGVGTPVLMLSALGRTSDRAEGLDAGADDYLAKPFEPEELMARLRALCRRSPGRESSEELRVGKSVSVRVDLGGRRIIQKKTQTSKPQ